MAEAGGVPIALQARPGILLRPNQQLVFFGNTFQDVEVFSPYPWVANVLGPGLNAHVVDFNTGAASPYTAPIGFAVTVIEKSYNFNQDCEGWLYLDGWLAAAIAGTSSGHAVQFSDIVGYSTKLFDPLALLAHTMDVVVYNRGLGNMRGGIEFVVLLEAVGTPPFPTKKDTQCPHCRALTNVPVHTTTIVCPKCHKTYFVYDTTLIRRMS